MAPTMMWLHLQVQKAPFSPVFGGLIHGVAVTRFPVVVVTFSFPPSKASVLCCIHVRLRGNSDLVTDGWSLKVKFVDK